MYALIRLIEGLAFAHALWGLFYLTGTLVDSRAESETGGPEALLRVLLYSAAGMALWGFAGFVLGTLHLFEPLGLTLAFAAFAAAFRFVRGERPWTRAFWARRARLLRQAVSVPAAIVYVAALMLSVPAVVPDFSYDGVRFHLAYAYEWVRAAHIYADDRMRFPYYTFNTELLDAMIMIARAGRFVTFLSWLSGTIVALGVTAMLAFLDRDAQARRGRLERIAAQAVYALVPFSLLLCAVFLRWWPTAMTDVVASLMFFAATAGFVACAIRYDLTYLRVCAICAAFLAGMKPSYLVLLPVFALALVVATRRSAGSPRTAWALIGALLVLSSPWYARNLIADGDPVPPVFNLMLHGRDRYITAADWAHVTADYSPRRTPGQWAAFPADEFLHPQSPLFREYGVTAVVFFLYAILALAPVLAARKSADASQAATARIFVMTAAGLAYVLAISALTRYSLLVYPCVCICAGVLVLDLCALLPRGILAAPVAAALLAIPSPGSGEFYREFRGVYYAELTQILPSDETALERFVPGYAEARPIFGAPVLSSDPSVLLIEAPLNYYVELHGGQPIGDYVGVGRYADALEAIDAGRARAYVDAHRIGAIVVNRTVNILVPDEIAYLREQLRAAGWRELPSSDALYAVFLRS